MPPKIANSKPDPRVPIAMNMMADLFLRSITRFSPLSKLPKLTAVDERLKERALQAIQAKSPEDRKISVTKVSQLGTGNLWKGLDLGPQRVSKSPGNQQRLQTSVNQSPLNPQQRRYQNVQTNAKIQIKPETRINQNSPKRPIQRNHNRAGQNNLNDSRNIGQMKQVTGNIVSQNLVRNQKSIRDDFAINDKSMDKRRKYSNQNDKSLNVKSIGKNGARNMTESRALHDSKEKRVTFSPEKPRQHSLDKKQVSQVKKTIETKPSPIMSPRTINIKQQKSQPYVYVPPTKRVVTNQEQKTQQNQSIKIQNVQSKGQNNQINLQPKGTGNISITPTPVKEQPKKPDQAPVFPVATANSQIKIKSREQILAEQEKSRKTMIVSPPTVSSSTYVYQPSVKILPKPQEPKIEVKKITPLQQQVISKPQPSPVQRTQTSPKKVGFNLSQNNQKKAETSVDSQRPAIKTTINRTIVIDQNVEIKKNVTILKNPQNNNVQKSNVSLDISSPSKSPQKQQALYRVGERKKNDVSVQEMKKDWSKIKQNLKYDRSYSPSNTNSKKVPERQDIALKMLAQLFLDASTRYFPGLSMLLKRGISKQEIDKIRSKSSQFKINISTVDRKSLVKPQPKTDRKLNWKGSQQTDKQKEKQNNRMFQADVTATQYKIKKPEEIAAENKKANQSLVVNKSQPQDKQKNLNIVSQNLQKNNKRITRDDSNLDKQKREPSQRSNSIRESPDVYRRETSRKDLEDSKKNLQKMKNEANKSQYFYQPPVKSPQTKNITPVPKKVEERPVQKTVTVTKPESVAVIPVKKQEPKPIPSRPVIKQEVKQPQKVINKNETSRKSINVTQPKPQIKSPVKSPTYNIPSTKKQQQSTYVYQPPAKRQPRNNSPQENSQIAKPAPESIINQRSIVSVSPKPDIKPPMIKQQISKQIVQSKSQTNIIQPQKPVINQPIKPVALQINKPVVEEKNKVNYGQKTPQNLQIKPNPKPYSSKPQQPIANNNSLKNISVISSKSQTSLTQQIKKSPVQPIKLQQPTYQPPSKSPTNQSNTQGYVYQPPSKKDTNITTQHTLPAKTDNSQTLRNVQSQKAIKTYDPKEKSQETTMVKRQQKITIAHAQSPKNNQSTVILPKGSQITEQKKEQKSPVNKNKQSEIIQPRPESKRFSTIVLLVLKRRVSSNYAFSFQKIQQKAKTQSQFIKHASFLSRSLVSFAHKYQQLLLRNAFNSIKTNIVVSVNKIIKQNKPVQENQHFSSGRKQSSSRIIFWLLSSKISSFFQPLRKLYLNVSNKGKVKQNVIQAMLKIFEKRNIINKKTGFKAIKSYKNQRQAVLSIFATTLQRINYNAILQNFSTLINKDIKQLAAKVKTVKQTSITQLGSKPPVLSQVQKTLQKSKSQQVLLSGKAVKEQMQNVETTRYSPADEAKLQSKRKELERKVNDLENRKQSLQQQTNNLNKDKRQKTKKNGDLKIKLKELEKELENQEANQPQPQSPRSKSKQRQASLTEVQLIPVLTRIYAYLFEDPDNTQIVVERFLSDNQHCFQLPTNPALMNEWKVIHKNAELKRLVKLYEGQQPREKRIAEVLQEENHLMGKLLRSFVRERYIWEWVNIIAHE